MFFPLHSHWRSLVAVLVAGVAIGVSWVPLLRFIQLYIWLAECPYRGSLLGLQLLACSRALCSVASSGLSHSSMSPFSSVMGFILCIEKFSRSTDSSWMRRLSFLSAHTYRPIHWPSWETLACGGYPNEPVDCNRMLLIRSVFCEYNLKEYL